MPYSKAKDTQMRQALDRCQSVEAATAMRNELRRNSLINEENQRRVAKKKGMTDEEVARRNQYANTYCMEPINLYALCRAAIPLNETMCESCKEKKRKKEEPPKEGSS